MRARSPDRASRGSVAAPQYLLRQPEIELVVDLHVLLAVEKHPLDPAAVPVAATNEVRAHDVHVAVVVEEAFELLARPRVRAVRHRLAHGARRERIGAGLEEALDAAVDQALVADRRR